MPNWMRTWRYGLGLALECSCSNVGAGLLQVDHRPRAVRQVLRLLGRDRRQRGSVVRAAVLELVQPRQVDEALQGERHAGQVLRRIVARVEMLVLGAVGDVQRAAL